ncbi:MAG TPA: hypothetical protein VJ303_03530 [Steroidobacteraceae bacterium]|jgi:hypothetical protein|nr:hypothetical protein [Steroidobacteraceae bacterium]
MIDTAWHYVVGLFTRPLGDLTLLDVAAVALLYLLAALLYSVISVALGRRPPSSNT